MSDNSSIDRIVHICPRADWEEAQRRGEYRALSLESEGFIHCSRPEQVVDVANQFYRATLNLLLLWIDPPVVQAEIRWEPVGNQVFPHIYGALNLDAVRSVDDFLPDANGFFHQAPGL
jgi:uncharacterized protein (DUF952 family)